MTAFPSRGPRPASQETDVDGELAEAEAHLAREEAQLDAEAAKLDQARAELETSLAEVRAVVEEARRAEAADEELISRVAQAAVPSLTVGELRREARQARLAAVEARRAAAGKVKQRLSEVRAEMSALAKALEHDRKQADRAVVRAAARARTHAREERERSTPAPVAPAGEETAPTVIAPLDVSRPLRISPRVKMQAAVDLESDSNFFTGFSSNISDGGLFVATVNFLAIGTRVDLAFTLPSGERVEAHGEVRWIRDIDDKDPDTFPGMGIRFLELADAEQVAISRFVESREPLFYAD